MMRSLDTASKCLRERKLTGRVGVELSQARKFATAWWASQPSTRWDISTHFRHVVKEVVDAAPLLAEVRTIKTPQEIERMKLANDLAATGMEFARKEYQARA